MKVYVLAGVLALTASAALADGKIYVQLPDLSAVQGVEAESLLRDVVSANVLQMNCFATHSEEDWSLLSDSGDMLAYVNLGLTATEYDDDYYHPAFALLDEAGACERYSGRVEKVLRRLEAAGGGRVPLPDQEAAYLEWRAWQDRISR